jgi:hypothetical protein
MTKILEDLVGKSEKAEKVDDMAIVKETIIQDFRKFYEAKGIQNCGQLSSGKVNMAWKEEPRSESREGVGGIRIKFRKGEGYGTKRFLNRSEMGNWIREEAREGEYLMQDGRVIRENEVETEKLIVINRKIPGGSGRSVRAKITEGWMPLIWECEREVRELENLEWLENDNYIRMVLMGKEKIDKRFEKCAKRVLKKPVALEMEYLIDVSRILVSAGMLEYENKQGNKNRSNFRKVETCISNLERFIQGKEELKEIKQGDISFGLMMMYPSLRTLM